MNHKIQQLLPILLLVFILISTCIFMLNASKKDSATMDELAHIPAGYSYVKFLDYRLNPEHPPLLKALSALPLLIFDIKFDTKDESWTNGVNDEWTIGKKFLYESGNNADQIINTARIFPIVLTILTTALIYFFSKESLGRWWALVPSFFFGLSPTVIAHGHYVTTDIAATTGLIIATYFFIKYLSKPSCLSLIWAGVTLGLAELTKFSSVLLVPYFFIIFLTFCYVNKSWLIKRFIGFLLILIIALIVVWAIYFLLTLNYPLQKQTIDNATLLGDSGSKQITKLIIILTKNNFTRAIAHYLLGILMVIHRTSWGNTNYFWGEVSNSGSRLYFPTIFLIKEPLPSLLFIATAIIIFLFKSSKKYLRQFPENSASATNYLKNNFFEFTLILFVTIYWFYSIKSPLNIGLRHILPTLPFIYILATKIIKNSGLTKKYIVLGLIMLWYFIETSLAAPYFLSYFNSIGGGIKNGYHYTVDSNYDWGQDLKRMSDLIEYYNSCSETKSPENCIRKKCASCASIIKFDQPIRKIAVDYFGGGDPKYYLGDKAEIWRSNKGNPKNQNIEWLAVSISTLEGAIGKLKNEKLRGPEDEYKWLSDSRSPGNGLGQVPAPDFIAGTSIFFYHL